MKCSVEVVRKVYDDDDGVYIEVGPNADNPDWINVSTKDEISMSHYGKIDFNIPPEQARLLGCALIDASDAVTMKK